MEALKSIEIIESMIWESKKSLQRNSFYFLLWGGLLIPSAIVEYLLQGNPNNWMVWPAMGIIGGIIATIYGRKESQRSGVFTVGDRITAYTWGGFLFTLVFAIIFSVSQHFPPHGLILLLAGWATFISGGISRFKPFVYGAIFLEIGAILCGFFVAPEFHPLVFAGSLFLGYIIPGILLMKLENGKA